MSRSEEPEEFEYEVVVDEVSSDEDRISCCRSTWVVTGTSEQDVRDLLADVYPEYTIFSIKLEGETPKTVINLG